MLELEGHPEERAFHDELLQIAAELAPGLQVLVHLEGESLENAHKLGNPKSQNRTPKEDFMQLVVNSSSRSGMNPRNRKK